MHGEPPALDELERLATSTDIRDRAFAANVLSLRRHLDDPERVAALYERIREAARSQHAEMRGRIQDGTLDKHAFVAHLRDAPLEIRDHLVEEILGVAYPPLEETSLPREAIPYCPSGLAEILFTIEKAHLGPGATFVDLGSGLGKVVLLVALLTGARTYGVELDPHLVSHARSAAAALHLENALFIEGDIRDAPLPPADVYYMYIPLVRPTALVTRLLEHAAERRILVFSQSLDLRQLPWLRAAHAASYWLEMYEGSESAARLELGRSVSERARHLDARRLFAEKRAHAIAECERRIHEARAAVFAASDGVVTARMTDLEREWRTLSRRDAGTEPGS
jgi:SAM-dependent methyltransferase